MSKYKLVLAQALVSFDDLIIFILNGLGIQFKEISAVFQTRQFAISFEDFHDKLFDYEIVLTQEDMVLLVATAAYFVRKPEVTSLIAVYF